MEIIPVYPRNSDECSCWWVWWTRLRCSPSWWFLHQLGSGWSGTGCVWRPVSHCAVWGCPLLLSPQAKDLLNLKAWFRKTLSKHSAQLWQLSILSLQHKRKLDKHKGSMWWHEACQLIFPQILNPGLKLLEVSVLSTICPAEYEGLTVKVIHNKHNRNCGCKSRLLVAGFLFQRSWSCSQHCARLDPVPGICWSCVVSVATVHTASHQRFPNLFSLNGFWWFLWCVRKNPLVPYRGSVAAF